MVRPWTMHGLLCRLALSLSVHLSLLTAIMSTGIVWSRYSTQIIPVNYNLLAVNVGGLTLHGLCGGSSTVSMVGRRIDCLHTAWAGQLPLLLGCLHICTRDQSSQLNTKVSPCMVCVWLPHRLLQSRFMVHCTTC